MKSTRTLFLRVKKQWFDEIKAGTKKYEYRLRTPYWQKRLSHEYDMVVVTLGYPPRDCVEKILVFPWRGYVEKDIVHPEWKNELQPVFAIRIAP